MRTRVPNAAVAYSAPIGDPTWPTTSTPCKPPANSKPPASSEEQAEAIALTMRRAAAADQERLTTKADLYQVALAIVVANAAITFGLLKLIP